MDLTQLITGSILSTLAGWIAYKRDAISVTGFIALVSITVLFLCLSGWNWFLLLFFMFGSSSALTRYRHGDKADMDSVIAKTGPRDAQQAFANFGASIVCFLTYQFYPSEIVAAAYIGSVAGVNADSWASEIGGLSKKPPRMITNFSIVPKGISGGVTFLGTVGGILGSAFISITGLYLISLSINLNHPGKIFIAAFSGGVLGLITDSLIGDKFQILFENVKGYTEQAMDGAHQNKIIKGCKYINNDLVNLIAAFFACFCTSIIYILLD